jgi:hypothetical protein
MNEKLTVIWRILYLSLLPLLLATGMSVAYSQEEDDERHENPEARQRLRVMQRLDNTGQIAFDALIKAKEETDQLLELQHQSPRLDAGLWDWEWLGPGNIGGRIRSILIDRVFTSWMWAGSAGGGIWRTTDGGYSWSPVNDFMANLAVTSLAGDPTNVNVMYAGTGEGFANIDALQGAGIFKSTDRGNTWSQLPSTNNQNFYWVNRIAQNPLISGHILAAVAIANPGFATTGRIYRSTNGGTTWTGVLSTSVRMADVKYDPASSNIVLAATGMPPSGSASDVYYSNTGGLSWTRMTTGTPGMLPSNTGRCEVAFGPLGVMYVSMDRNNGEIWRSVDAGASWELRNTGTSYFGTNGQGWYDNALWVSPVDGNFIVVGGVDLYRSTDGGLNLQKISRWQNALDGTSPHADHHVIVSHPGFNGGTNSTVYFGNDGGVYATINVSTVSQDAGWFPRNNGLGVTQFYGGAAAPGGNIIVGGAQDNDKLHYSPANGTNWLHPTNGDGGFAAVDYINPNILYGEYVFLDIRRSDDGGVSYSSKISGLSDAQSGATSLFISPFSMDPNVPAVLVAGGTSIWRTQDNADNWSAIRGPVPGLPGAGSPACSAIDIAHGNGTIIWVGYANGRVSRSSWSPASGWSWTDVDGPIPDRYVTDIAINPFNSDEVFVTIGGYLFDDVWMTTNAGQTWQDRTGLSPYNLPAVQVNTVRYNPQDENWVYVGTDLGVFGSEDKGLHWSILRRYASNEGPANVAVDELFWQGSEYLIAATHGRGMYRARIPFDIFVDISNPLPGDGTAANPYHSLTAGVNTQVNGTTLHINTGTYPEAPIRFNKRGQIITTNGIVTVR